MKKHYKIIGLTSYFVFTVLNLIRLFIQDYLSDFQLGFVEGVLLATMVISIIYMIACIVKHENMYKI